MHIFSLHAIYYIYKCLIVENKHVKKGGVKVTLKNNLRQLGKLKY